MKKNIVMPNTMAASQIDKIIADYRTLLERHSGELSAEAVQIVSGQPEFMYEQFGIFRRRVESISTIIVRKVSVNCDRSPQEALNATGCMQCIDPTVMNSIHKVTINEIKIVFFKLDLFMRGDYISDDDLTGEFGLRGLEPADPISVAAVNEKDPVFAGQIPHGTHWKDGNGKWCYAMFNHWKGVRQVYIGRGIGWRDYWWFAGVQINSQS